MNSKQHQYQDEHDDSLVLFGEIWNNCSLKIPVAKASRKDLITLAAPKLGIGNVVQNTNSSFSNVSKLVSYNWEQQENVNILAVHSSQPMIAYLINIGYSKAVTGGRIPKVSNPAEQAIKLLNYKTQNRALLKDKFSNQVVDLSFSYTPTNGLCSGKLAVIDDVTNVYIFGYKENAEGATKLEFKLLTKIISETGISNEMSKVTWCPFMPSEEDEKESGVSEDDDKEAGDSWMKLAVTAGNKIEIFAIDKVLSIYKEKLTRAEIRQVYPYQELNNRHAASIISVTLSNDGTAICTSSLDNHIKFFQVTPLDTKELHNWTPKIDADDQISNFFFLDDYMFLLETNRETFWEFAFVGTKKGNMSIWDLRKWTPVQRIQIKTDDPEDEYCISSDFSYKSDITSHFIIALKDNMACLFKIEFIEPDDTFDDGAKVSSKDDDDDENTDSKYAVPKIVQVTRFQIYNPIISYVIKRDDPDNLDIFWITSKQFENCSINMKLLAPETLSTQPLNTNIGHFSPSNKTTNQQPSIRFNGTNILSKQASANSNNLLELTSDGHLSSTPPPITLAQLFNTSHFKEPSPIGYKDTSPIEYKSPSPSIDYKLKTSSNRYKAQTPTSEEVATILSPNDMLDFDPLKKLFPKNKESILDSSKDLLLSPVTDAVPKHSQRSYSNITTTPHRPSPAIPAQPFQGDVLAGPSTTLTENQANDIELKILKQFKELEIKLAERLDKMDNKMDVMKDELKEAAQFKNNQINKVIDGLVKKVMIEMNQVMHSGLKEFVNQIHGEVFELVSSITKSKGALRHQSEQMQQQIQQHQQEISELQKALQQMYEQQKLSLKELQQCEQQMQQQLSQIRFLMIRPVCQPRQMI